MEYVPERYTRYALKISVGLGFYNVSLASTVQFRLALLPIL